jgi:hypothetical protein
LHYACNLKRNKPRNGDDFGALASGFGRYNCARKNVSLGLRTE